MCIHHALSGGPGHSRDFQQLVHGNCGADGSDLAERELFGEHQGAARLQMRAL